MAMLMIKKQIEHLQNEDENEPLSVKLIFCCKKKWLGNGWEHTKLK